MYFKKLEIIGFKSFYNKTILNFEPGITAIVGPNGCGKSNIFDAIRWALGEQSAKALRGSEMLDVIFNGTDTKEPLGMAEVSITFDNKNRLLNVNQDEVVITRRIFRSGEGEYLLNKAPVRLKDILDLLMGTGIGAESYSLVAQGKIDLILSSHPEDRRLVFDEAAGITKYKMQKKEAMRKLEETEQNLLRVNDIITEVKRQIGSLERQANKARKYKEVFEELKQKEVNLGILQKIALEEEKKKISEQVNLLNQKENELLLSIKEEETKIETESSELKNIENQILNIKNELLNLNNLILRNKERINFNEEKLQELISDKKYLEKQLEQTKDRLKLDEQKLNNFKSEYENINKTISDKNQLLNEKNKQLEEIAHQIKNSLENINQTKKDILDLSTKISQVKNTILDLNSQRQIYLARKKRLELERAKVKEEISINEEELKNLEQQLQNCEKEKEDLNANILEKQTQEKDYCQALEKINLDLSTLEKELLNLNPQREFLGKLKSEYEGIDEAMNAIIYLDKAPKENLSGLVIKIKDYLKIDENDKGIDARINLKLKGEAKPIDLDTQRIEEKIKITEEKINILQNEKKGKENILVEIEKLINELKENLRNQEMILVNKEANFQSILEQFNKIKEEEEIINIELLDVEKELVELDKKDAVLKQDLNDLENKQKMAEELINQEQNNINLNNKLKEEALIIITQTKTEIEALNKRLSSEKATLSILEDTYQQDKLGILNLEEQIKDNQEKYQLLFEENAKLLKEIKETEERTRNQNQILKETQDKHSQLSSGYSQIIEKINRDKENLDIFKNQLHQLQLQEKDIEFKISSIKQRILQVYQVDLDSLENVPIEIDQNLLSEEIRHLKEKLDAYGAVNLVAIEEYDELKKRYDFLITQQNDLITAKESLREAITKINRTTKKMFLDTLEMIRQEFRNYFRLLFNGGDAQIFLVDEEDPLESGIEIICRPPGKKLQNVLLLSGGEKSLAAIALIFAIFKIKPAPFCVLDEIDAALDEANIDRYSRFLQEFAKTSQFIVITHNKRTIVNADVMYGITMEESGISKIVSVKFAQNKTTDKNKEPNMVVA